MVEQEILDEREVCVAEAIESAWLRLDECDWNWVALYGDGMALTQYGPDGERSFGDLDQARLVGFFVTNGGGMLGVDLDTGEFMVNDVKVRLPGCSCHGVADEDRPYRLIYFRRHMAEYAFSAGELSHEVTHCVGWQRANGDGATDKRILGAITEWDEGVGQAVMVLVSVEE